MRDDDARPTSMSHYYHIGTGRVVTTPHGERTRRPLERNERKLVAARDRWRERERAGEGEKRRNHPLYFSSNRFDTFLPPLISDVAYNWWTTVRKPHVNVPFMMGNCEGCILLFVCDCLIVEIFKIVEGLLRN